MNFNINSHNCRGNLPTSKEDAATEEKLILEKKVIDCANCGDIKETTKIELLALIHKNPEDKNQNITFQIAQALKNVS